MSKPEPTSQNVPSAWSSTAGWRSTVPVYVLTVRAHCKLPQLYVFKSKEAAIEWAKVNAPDASWDDLSIAIMVDDQSD